MRKLITVRMNEKEEWKRKVKQEENATLTVMKTLHITWKLERALMENSTSNYKIWLVSKNKNKQMFIKYAKLHPYLKKFKSRTTPFLKHVYNKD